MTAYQRRSHRWVELVLIVAAMIALVVATAHAVTHFTVAPPRSPAIHPDVLPLAPDGSTVVRVAAEGAGAQVVTSDNPTRNRGTILRMPEVMRYGQWVWNEPARADGPVWIRVRLERQLISVFRGGDEIGAAVVIYGADDKPTPPGVYFVRSKLREHRSSLYDAEMPYTLGLTDDGIAIHASIVRPGTATHGCIGVPESFARKLFGVVKKGTKVLIEA